MDLELYQEVSSGLLSLLKREPDRRDSALILINACKQLFAQIESVVGKDEVFPFFPIP